MTPLHILFFSGLAVLSSCRTPTPCPESFEKFPQNFSALQRLVIPKLKLPASLAVALIKVDHNGRNWDVILMDPILQTPLLEFHKKGFSVTHESPISVANNIKNLDVAFLALRYFYELEDFTCAEKSMTRDIRNIHFVLSDFRGKEECRFPYRIEITTKDGDNYIIETVNVTCS